MLASEDAQIDTLPSSLSTADLLGCSKADEAHKTTRQPTSLLYGSTPLSFPRPAYAYIRRKKKLTGTYWIDRKPTRHCLWITHAGRCSPTCLPSVASAGPLVVALESQLNTLWSSRNRSGARKPSQLAIPVTSIFISAVSGGLLCQKASRWGSRVSESS